MPGKNKINLFNNLQVLQTGRKGSSRGPYLSASGDDVGLSGTTSNVSRGHGRRTPRQFASYRKFVHLEDPRARSTFSLAPLSDDS